MALARDRSSAPQLSQVKTAEESNENIVGDCASVSHHQSDHIVLPQIATLKAICDRLIMEVRVSSRPDETTQAALYEITLERFSSLVSLSTC